MGGSRRSAVAPDDAERLVKDAHRFEAIRLFCRPGRRVPAGFTLGPGNAADVAAILPRARRDAAGHRAWPRRGSGCCHRSRSAPAWVTDSSCSPRATGPRRSASRPGARRSNGATSCCLPRSGSCSADCPSSPDGRWRWPSRCAPTMTSPHTRRVLDLLTALVDKSLVALEPAVMGEASTGCSTRSGNTRRPAWRRAEGESARVPAPRCATTPSGSRSGTWGDQDGAKVPATWSARVRNALRQYDVEARNVIQVLTWCVAQGDAETVLRMCAAVSPCWIVWGTFAEGREWLDSILALETLGATGQPGARPPSCRPSSPCPAIASRPRPWPAPGWELCRAAGDPVLDGVRAEPARRDRPAHGADRGGGEHRG